MRRHLPRAGAAGAGGALSLVFPTPSLWFWAYVGLVPILVLVAGAATWREAGLRSWWAALGFNLGLHHWLVPSIGPFALPVAGALAVLWIPWGLAAHRLLRAPGWVGPAGAVVVLPSIWVLIEHVRSWDRLGGSWGLLGLSQWQVRPVLSVAALGGVWALSWLLVATNAGVTLALTRTAADGVRWAGALAATGLVAAAAVHGWTRAEPDVEEHLRIGGVQAGVVHDPEDRLAVHERLTADLHGQGVDVVVWGQSSVGFDPEVDDEVLRRLTAAADGAGVDVLVNVDARGVEGRIQKSARLITSGGQAEPVYDKQRLVPFGEYIPFRSVFGWVARFTDAADEDRAPGADVVLMHTAGVAIGPLISYESTFPDLRRAVARLDPHLTVVQGAATTFQGSWALPQQASFEAIRAVESGRPAVLAQVSGTSAAFDARGRRLSWVDQHERTAYVVDVPLSREATPYVRWGDWVIAGSALITALTAAAATGPAVRRRVSG